MSRIAIATLQTPWDCKWSRFGRIHSARPDAQVEGLWVCVHGDGVRRPIDASTCETCPYWEYQYRCRFNHGSSPEVSVQSQGIPACPYESRAEKRLAIGTRVAVLALAVLLAGMGFVVLARPLAVPLTIILWMGALTSLWLEVRGRFNRRALGLCKVSGVGDGFQSAIPCEVNCSVPLTFLKVPTANNHLAHIRPSLSQAAGPRPPPPPPSSG